MLLADSKHTAATIKINENEPLLLKNMETFLVNLSPRGGGYQNNDFSIRTVDVTPDESPNERAHFQHLLLGASEIIPLIGGHVPFGVYQSVFFNELGHNRSREVTLQVAGEWVFGSPIV